MISFLSFLAEIINGPLIAVDIEARLGALREESAYLLLEIQTRTPLLPHLLSREHGFYLLLILFNLRMTPFLSMPTGTILFFKRNQLFLSRATLRRSMRTPMMNKIFRSPPFSPMIGLVKTASQPFPFSSALKPLALPAFSRLQRKFFLHWELFPLNLLKPVCQSLRLSQTFFQF